MAGWKPTIASDDGGEQPDVPVKPRRRRVTTRPRVTPQGQASKERPEDPVTPNLKAAQEASPRVHTNARPSGGRRHTDPTDKRRSVKVTLGQRWSEIVLAIKAGEYTWREFVEGLDEEELALGKLRAADGSFEGRPPALVPREFHLACQREQKRRFEELFGSEVLELTRDFLRLCKDKEISPKDRAKLLQYAMERVFGGIPRDVRISSEQPWEEMMVNVHADEGEMPAYMQRRYAGYQDREGSGTDGN